MNRHHRKAECVELILALRDHGVTSPTLIAEALGISKAYAWRILNEDRRSRPRSDLKDLLGGLPTDLRARVTRFSEPRFKSETAFTNSCAKELKPA